MYQDATYNIEKKWKWQHWIDRIRYHAKKLTLTVVKDAQKLIVVPGITQALDFSQFILSSITGLKNAKLIVSPLIFNQNHNEKLVKLGFDFFYSQYRKLTNFIGLYRNLLKIIAEIWHLIRVR